MSDQADRPMRSVFVGNIPYEVTEEQLKGIFSEVGPVQSLKLVYDRETGKPKGYGFCEYKDVETALIAMRNLNGYEINGRTLRVDNAGAERHRMAEIGQNGPRHVDNENSYAYGEDGPVPPEKAPEVIARTVASLPPEQMFDLMKQMKLCIQNNPNEARTMLLQNPQLAYALLQALVVMKIVDPSIALSMLHKDSSVPVGALMPEGQMAMMPGGMPGPPAQTDNPWIAAVSNQNAPLMPMNPPGPFPHSTGGMPTPVPVQSGDMDLRQLDPRLRGPVPSKDFDLRDPRAQDRYIGDPRRERVADRDLRDPRGFPPGSGQSSSVPPVSDPRQRRDGGMVPGPNPAAGRPSAAPPLSLSGFRDGATDAEKASLIMQVMSISDEQLAQLPPEQRQSILVLKESIAKSTSQKR